MNYGNMYGQLQSAAGMDPGNGLALGHTMQQNWQKPKIGLFTRMAPNAGVAAPSVMGQPMQPWQQRMTGQFPSMPQPMANPVSPWMKGSGY